MAAANAETTRPQKIGSIDSDEHGLGRRLGEGTRSG